MILIVTSCTVSEIASNATISLSDIGIWYKKDHFWFIIIKLFSGQFYFPTSDYVIYFFSYIPPFNIGNSHVISVYQYVCAK